MLWFLVAAAALIAAYYVFSEPFNYWKKKGALQQSRFDIIKGTLNNLLQLVSPAEAIEDIHNSFGNARYGGAYQFFNPVLFLKDPELIKQITVKDFEHFVDHREFIPEENEPLWGKNLFALKGDKWKDMRATLSPSFTSSKMRSMFILISECAQRFVQHFKTEDKKTVTIEMKDAFTRFTNDVIASVAFGVTIDSLKDRDNEFYLRGKEATNFRGFLMNIKILIMFVNAELAKKLKLKIFSDGVTEFFRRLVRENIESREKNGIVRPDMIHLLMEAKKGRLRHEHHGHEEPDSGFAVIEESAIGKEEKRRKQELTDDDLTAQALIFFFAGFETVSILMCFAAYELAVHGDIQKRLQEEIDETLKECNGSLTYEAILKMKYMDMVVSETLRKWPGAVAVDRVCVKPYTIEPTRAGERPVQVDKNDTIWLPIYAIHRDASLYPDPHKFDPERFSDENKASIRPYSYLPFGSGPRSCIGNRFALLESKTVLFHILANFDIVVVEKSQIPVRLVRNQFNLGARDGFWFGLKPRV